MRDYCSGVLTLIPKRNFPRCPTRFATMGAQLELPLLCAPESVRAHGLRAAHPRPLVSLGKQPGRPFNSFRTTPKRAWSYPEVEYANAGSSYAALVLDCDDPAALKLGMSDLPDCPSYKFRPAQKSWYFGRSSDWLRWLRRRTSS